jgi:hypothetical protein
VTDQQHEQPDPPDLTDAEREAAERAGWDEQKYADLRGVKNVDEWWEARKHEQERASKPN